LLVAMLSLTLLAVSPAHAQQRGVTRLPRGLFGGGIGEAAQVLSVGVSAGGGYNSTKRPLEAAVAANSTFGHVAGNVDYSFSRPTIQLFATSVSSGHYYSGGTGRFPTRHVATAGASFIIPVSGRTALTVSQNATYQPLEIVSPFPALAQAGLEQAQAFLLDPDLATTTDGYVSYAGGASLARELSRQTTVSVGARYSRSGRLSGTELVTTGEVGGRFTRQLARGLSAGLGYIYTRGTYSGDVPGSHFDHHTIDAGVNFNRALSLTRRTGLSFATGSTVVSDGVRHTFHVRGNARLRHDISPDWRASVAYRRDVNFLGTVRAPVFSDSLTIGLNGVLGEWLYVHASVGAAIGEVGLGQGSDFRSYYGRTGVTFGLTRYLGLDLNYSYYRSTFATAALLSPGVPDHFDRQSVRASARLWLPLIHRVGRANAAR
jgi:hypothetical protein